MQKKIFLALLVILLAACTQIPVATATRAPKATATTPPISTSTPTATLNPNPIQLITDYRICPRQEVRFNQVVAIEHNFTFGSKTTASWFAKWGIGRVTIDGKSITVDDSGLWSPVTVKDLGEYGKYYATTFRWVLPPLSVGEHRIDIVFSVPALFGADSRLFPECAVLNVLPR